MKFYVYAESLPAKINTPYISDLKLPFALVHEPATPTPIDDFENHINITHNVYDFPPIIKKFLEPALPKLYEKFTKNYYNSRMLRLEKYDGTIQFGAVYYSDHSLIHHSADEEIYNGQTIRDALEDVLFDEILEPNTESVFPNGVGANILMITADNYIIIPKRSKSVSIGKNKYAPSISFATRHKMEPSIIQWNIKNALIREYEYIPSSNAKIFYLGLYRDLYTLGAPEMYFVMKITEGIEEFEAKINEEIKHLEAVETGGTIDNITSIADALNPDETSEHLYMLLYLIKKYKNYLTDVL